jgi:hypothetical protein
LLSAKNVGVKWTDFPQSWLLEPETSETEKTIRKLQIAADVDLNLAATGVSTMSWGNERLMSMLMLSPQ